MKNKVFFCIIILGFLLGLTSFAQEKTPQKQWQTFTEYNSRYPGTHTLVLFVDNKGLLWGGTKGAGVFTFDGKTWQHFTKSNGLSGNVVHAIAQNEAGMWFGTFINGVSFFNGEEWSTYQSSDGLPHQFVRAISVRAEKIWFGTQGGVGMFDGKKWHKYTTRGEFDWFRNNWKIKRPYATIEGLPLNEVYDIKVTNDDKVWAATYNGLSQFNSSNWLTHRPPQAALSDNEIKCLAVDGTGGIWIGTHTGGLVQFKDRKWTVYTTEDGLAHQEVNAILVSGKVVWAATNGGGISRYDGETTWTTYTTEHGLSSNFVTSLAMDNNGIWAGFFGPGISRLEVKQ